MGGVLSCSQCPFGTFELAIIGNGCNFYVAKGLVSQWKFDFETFDQINRKSG